MQNLSFKSSMAVKPVEEATKNNVVASKTSQNSSNAQDDSGAQNTFQSLLNKQVQAKRPIDNSATKSASKTAPKSADSAQKNQQVEENDASDSDGKSVSDTHRANIDAMIARLKSLKQGGESEDSALAVEVVAKEVSEEDETLAALADAVNNMQPQDVMAQALMRAQLHSANSDNPSQKLEIQLTQDDSQSTLANSALSNVGVSALDRALSKEMSQSSSGDQSALPEQLTAGADRWKDVLSEKVPTQLSQEDVALIQDTRLTDSKTPSLENALKFLDNESAKEFLSKEASKEMSGVSALQTQQLSQATLNQPTQAATQLGSSNQIMAYPGRAGWNQEISQKVVWMVGNGEQSATLTLNPPDLGPVQVVISVHNDQADAAFFSDNADVRQALEDGLDNLRESMQSSGIQLGQANINAGQQSSQQSFQEMAQKQLGSAVKSQQSLLGADLPATGITLRESQGLVDTFA